MSHARAKKTEPAHVRARHTARCLAALSLALLWTLSSAAEKGAAQWDVAKPPLKLRHVPVDVTEGTWMNVDVSPDGRTIAFDLLGDIYTLPITGGTATRIASGLPYEVQPRYSPDGTQIAFTSDRGGGDNIWIMSADGSNKRPLTKETFTLLNNPTWRADGKYIAARKHFTATRSLGTGEIWMYHVAGGNGIALVERPDPQHQKELGEPTFTPDGHSIYFSRDTTPGGRFEYAQNSNDEVFAIERYDLQTGERTTVVGGPGGAARPAPSPDGNYLAYVRRERNHSKLYVKELRSGRERKIYDHLDQDLQETWAVNGVYPNMDWLPDSSAIVFWAGGRIRRVNADGSGAAEIPFHVGDTREVVDPSRPQVTAWQDTFETRMPRFASLSPDGRRIVVESLGRLHLQDTAGGPPRPLTAENGDFQLFPSWSRDGSRIVFVSWNDERLGEIRTVAADGGSERTITNIPGHYRRPRFSPDGATIVFERGSGGNLVSEAWSDNPGIYRVPSSGGDAVRLTKSGFSPHFAHNSARIYINVPDDKGTKLISVDLNGKDERVHAEGELVMTYEVSPSGDLLAFRENPDAYVMPFFAGAKKLTVGGKSEQMPVTRVSTHGAQYLHWRADGRTLAWSMGPTLYSTDASAAVRGDSSVGAYVPPKDGASIGRRVTADKPTGSLALAGAKVITMSDERGGVIEDGVVVIESNRIKAVGRRGDVVLPSGVKTVDVSGKTIVPGFIDAHAHGPQADGELTPQQNWSAHAHLAFGVTTIHDPAAYATAIFPAAEMQRAGVIIAPRTFSSGGTLYGAKASGLYAAIDSYEDALAHVRRLKVQGAHTIKNYNQPRRDQRQQVVAAALAENIAVVAEGASLFNQDITLIVDGNTTLEHNFPQAMLYEDVLSLFARTRVGYTPTLSVTYGGLSAEAYWLQESEVWKHPLLTRYVPAHVLQPEMVRVTRAPAEDYFDAVNARTAHMLSKRGVPVSIGAHGQQQGLAAHWEMWSFVRGGMSPLEALRAATSTPARSLGFTDIGSLEPGKLADLVVLDANPLENIRNTEQVDKVMLNGRLYDARTLNEHVTGTRVRRPYWWEAAQ